MKLNSRKKAILGNANRPFQERAPHGGPTPDPSWEGNPFQERAPHGGVRSYF